MGNWVIGETPRRKALTDDRCQPSSLSSMGLPMLRFWHSGCAGIARSALGIDGAAIFVVLWLAGYLGLPRIAWWTGHFRDSLRRVPRHRPRLRGLQGRCQVQPKGPVSVLRRVRKGKLIAVMHSRGPAGRNRQPSRCQRRRECRARDGHCVTQLPNYPITRLPNSCFR